MKKKIVLFSMMVLGIAAGSLLLYLNALLPIVTGYPAKYLCSAVFISGRDVREVESLDLAFSLVRYTRNVVDHTEKSVTSHFLWGKSKAVFREGLGAVLVREPDETPLKRRVGPSYPGLIAASPVADSLTWPAGDQTGNKADPKVAVKLEALNNSLFKGKKYGGTPFALLIIHDSTILSEHYRQGFSEKTRFLSWSMAKSFTNALAGMMVMDGMIDPGKPTGLKEWQSDSRSQITMAHLLRMESGLDWNEEYGNRSDVTRMLYEQPDFAAYAIEKDAVAAPGIKWYYSSGSTNIVNLLLRRSFSGDSAFYHYIQQRLFRDIGIRQAFFETDGTGTPVGSSYIYATARDYARFGILFLNDGMFGGRRLLPENWVRFTTDPVKQSNGAYGASFWLNRGGRYPNAPGDMFYANGHDGQRVFIIPSRKLVVVVLGYSPKGSNEMDFDLLLKDILQAVPQ